MKRLMILTLSLAAMVGCGGGGGGGGGGGAAITSTEPNDIEQLTVPATFDYGMAEDIQLSIDVAPAGFMPRSYVCLVYDTLPNSEDSLIGKYQTDQNGRLNTKLTLAKARQSLKVIVSAFGFPNEQVVNVQNGHATAIFR